MKHLCGAPLRNKKVHYYTHPLTPCYSERVKDEAFFKDAWCSGSQHALNLHFCILHATVCLHQSIIRCDINSAPSSA